MGKAAGAAWDGVSGTAKKWWNKYQDKVGESRWPQFEKFLVEHDYIDMEPFDGAVTEFLGSSIDFTMFLEQRVFQVKARRVLTEVARYVDPNEFVQWYSEEGQYYSPEVFEGRVGDFFSKLGHRMRDAWAAWKGVPSWHKEKEQQAIDAALQALTKVQSAHVGYIQSLPNGADMIPHLDSVLKALQQVKGIVDQDVAEGKPEGEERQPEGEEGQLGTNPDGRPAADAVSDPTVPPNDPAPEQPEQVTHEDAGAMADEMLQHLDMEKIAARIQKSKSPFGQEGAELLRKHMADGSLRNFILPNLQQRLLKKAKRKNMWKGWQNDPGAVKGVTSIVRNAIYDVVRKQSTDAQQQAANNPYGDEHHEDPTGGWGRDPQDMVDYMHTLYPTDQTLQEELSRRLEKSKSRLAKCRFDESDSDIGIAFGEG